MRNKKIQTASGVMRALGRQGSAEKSRASRRFFKTGEGQYGEGDVFIGVTMPELRAVAREFADLPLADISKLLKSSIHEHRLAALVILTGRCSCAGAVEYARLVKFYLAHTKCINNWDLVDVSASHILGVYFQDKKRDILYKLVRSKNMWERRIAIVSTHALIRRGDLADAFLLSEALLFDKEDLMHKAVGWTLREAGKQSRPALVQFLTKNIECIPRTALRYAIEHFPEPGRQKFLKMK